MVAIAKPQGDDFPGSSDDWPRLDVSATNKEVQVTAELAGLEEDDVEIMLLDGVLTLRGERTSESRSILYSERRRGFFQRSLQLGPDLDPENVLTAFKNGVLTITIAKRPEAQRRMRRIPVAMG
jgi:HSP20 family protein